MFKSKFFPFSFKDYYFDDASLHFEDVIFTDNLGPFSKGERLSHLDLDILTGELVSSEENDWRNNDDCEEETTEKKAILKVALTK